MISNRIRYFNKYITNPLLRRFANASRGPFAVIRHVGRRSGKLYETTIMVWPMGEGFVIALTYVIMSLVLAGEEAHPPSLDRADAVVEVIMRALTP